LFEERAELTAGDYIYYPADQRHIFCVLEADTLAVLISEQNQAE
jgi:quercetin dioxygenase-like cupin family protein